MNEKRRIRKRIKNIKSLRNMCIEANQAIIETETIIALNKKIEALEEELRVLEQLENF